jgi:2-polyprenyl-6-methoxyphenol hydroxylase-like FAD-dependent oxidoreductase
LPSRYAYALMCPQSETEAVLAARHEAFGGGVRRCCEVTDAVFDGEGVTAMLREGALEHGVRARYIVGCDGMHSVVRECAEIGFSGGEYPESFVLADVRMDWPLPREEVTLFFSPEGLMVVAPLPEERFRIVATVRNAPPEPSLADVQALLDGRGPIGTPGRVREIVWSSRFHVHHRLAETVHKGHALLVGDAAHVHSPAGGQGMNIGIQDAILLGEALEKTLTGVSDSALEEWAARRHEVAQDVVAFTDRMTRAATLESRAAQAVRNTVIQLVGQLPAARVNLAMRISELDMRENPPG